MRYLIPSLGFKMYSIPSDDNTRIKAEMTSTYVVLKIKSRMGETMYKQIPSVKKSQPLI